jgi:hypothetical protein
MFVTSATLRAVRREREAMKAAGQALLWTA